MEIGNLILLLVGAVFTACCFSVYLSERKNFKEYQQGYSFMEKVEGFKY